jgi:hypothetical protein
MFFYPPSMIRGLPTSVAVTRSIYKDYIFALFP